MEPPSIDRCGEYPPPPSQGLKKQNKGGNTHREGLLFRSCKFILQVASWGRMKDAMYVSKKIFWGLGRRKVAICLFWFDSCLTGLRQLFVCGALSELKKIYQPPATLTTRPRQRTHDLNFELERGGIIKKDFCFFLRRMTNKADVFFQPHW